jgi:predicted permease
MNSLVWILLILYVLIGVGVAVSKKWITNSTGEINLQNVLRLQTWTRLFFNPWTVLILAVSIGLFGVSMWVFSLEKANSIILVSMVLGLPATLFNVFLNKRILGEIVSSSQYVPISMTVVGYMLMIAGVWYFVGGIK